MLYKQIIECCKQYHEKYPGYDKAYNDYFKRNNPFTFDEAEIKKLVEFLDDFRCFPGEHAERNKRAVIRNLPPVLLRVISRLKPFKEKEKNLLTLQESDRKVIRDAYVELDNVCQIGDTTASKILHTINPKIFMMWDCPIRKKYAKDLKNADFISSVGEYYYADIFLPKMQRIANESIEQVMKEEESVSSYEDAIKWFIGNCKYNNSLAKIIDEYNFVISR